MRRFTSLLCFVGLAACGPEPQSGACAAYVACVARLDDARGSETNVDRFLPEGACWGSRDGAEQCTLGCEQGLELLIERFGVEGCE